MQGHFDGRIQVLVATMHQEDYSLLDQLRLQTDAVVINQCDRESVEEFDYNGNGILWINTCERGLSKSRNMAIKAATAEICLICDDDLCYRDGYAETILNAFDNRPEADIIRLQVEDITRPNKTYEKEPFKIGYLSAMKATSFELAFRRAPVVRHQLRFDELIGAGTEFQQGEENAFLYACLRHKMQIWYEPQVIADMRVRESTWFTGMDKRYFRGKGATFTALGTFPSWVLMWQFAVRKYPKYKNECSLVGAVSAMYQGRKSYLRKRKEQKG